MSGESFLLVVRLGFSLSLVFGLMWVAAKVLRGRAGALGRQKLDHLEVLERKPLGKGSSIAIVRVGEQVLTVGVTDSTVTLLGPADIEVATDAAVTPIRPVSSVSVVPSVSVVTPVDVAAPAPTGAATSAPTSTAPATATAGGRRSFLDTLRDKTVRHVGG